MPFRSYPASAVFYLLSFPRPRFSLYDPSASRLSSPRPPLFLLGGAFPALPPLRSLLLFRGGLSLPRRRVSVPLRSFPSLFQPLLSFYSPATASLSDSPRALSLPFSLFFCPFFPRPPLVSLLRARLSPFSAAARSPLSCGPFSFFPKPCSLSIFRGGAFPALLRSFPSLFQPLFSFYFPRRPLFPIRPPRPFSSVLSFFCPLFPRPPLVSLPRPPFSSSAPASSLFASPPRRRVSRSSAVLSLSFQNLVLFLFSAAASLSDSPLAPSLPFSLFCPFFPRPPSPRPPLRSLLLFRGGLSLPRRRVSRSSAVLSLSFPNLVLFLFSAAASLSDSPRALSLPFSLFCPFFPRPPSPRPPLFPNGGAFPLSRGPFSLFPKPCSLSIPPRRPLFPLRPRVPSLPFSLFFCPLFPRPPLLRARLSFPTAARSLLSAPLGARSPILSRRLSCARRARRNRGQCISRGSRGAQTVCLRPRKISRRIPRIGGVPYGCRRPAD